MNPEMAALNNYNSFKSELRAKQSAGRALSHKANLIKGIILSAAKLNLGDELAVGADMLILALNEI